MFIYTYSEEVHFKGTGMVLGRNKNLAPQNITEKLMEVYYLDEWSLITLYVAGLLHPVIF